MREVDDQMMLDAAINGRADVIGTHNLRNFLPAASRFSSRDVRPASFAGEGAEMNSATISVKAPPRGNAARKLAEGDDVSLNQWVSLAVAQKIGAVETAEAFSKRRSQGAEQGDFLEILRNAPDRTPRSRR